MNLMQILLSQPQKELVKRVKYREIPCNTNSRQELTEELCKNLLDKEVVEKEWVTMTTAERHLLLRMCFNTSLLMSTEDELRIFLKQEDRHLFEEVIQSLVEKSWLYRDENNCLQLPVEMQQWITNFTKQEWIENFLYIPIEKSMAYIVIDDLFHMMDHFGSKSLALTKNNVIYKKELTKILSLLSVQEEMPSEKWRFGYGRHFDYYPDCFSFLYDFCYEQKWIREERNLVVTEKWDKGQEMPVMELLDRMLTVYIKVYRRAIPQLPFVISLLKENLADGLAIDKQELVNKLKIFIDPYYYDDPENIVKTRIIKILQYIHFLSSKEIDGCQFIFLHPRLTERR